MARALAHIDGIREETLEAKGLSKHTTHLRHSLDLGALLLDQLQRLAEGASQAPQAVVLEVRADVVNQDETDSNSDIGANSPGPARQPDPSDGSSGLSRGGDIASPEATSKAPDSPPE